MSLWGPFSFKPLRMCECVCIHIYMCGYIHMCVYHVCRYVYYNGFCMAISSYLLFFFTALFLPYDHIFPHLKTSTLIISLFLFTRHGELMS